MSKVSFYEIKSNGNISGVQELDNSSELDDLLKSSNKVVLDVYADWCGPCKFIAPKFEELSKNSKYSEIKFAKMNLSSLSQNHLKLFNITALPAFLFFKNGQYAGKEVGANIQDIKSAMSKNLL